MAKTFNLKLQVKMSGAVLAWEVFLEKRNAASKVGAWVYNMEDKCYERNFDGYKIDDDTLEVFIGSEGKEGGKTSCKVIINDKAKTPEVISYNIDTNYAKGSYEI